MRFKEHEQPAEEENVVDVDAWRSVAAAQDQPHLSMVKGRTDAREGELRSQGGTANQKLLILR